MQNFIEVKNGNPGFQGAWLKPENLGLTEALMMTTSQWMQAKPLYPHQTEH